MELKKHPWKQCEFELYKDNEPTGKIYILNDENNWCIEEWLDDEHEYDFREINIPRGYKPKYYRYRDDQINERVAINSIVWTINIMCVFEDNNNSKGLRPKELSFGLTHEEESKECVLNNGSNWTCNYEDIQENDINELQYCITSNINDTPVLLFYNQNTNVAINESEHNIKITYTFTFNDDINNIFQNLMNSELANYATNSMLNELNDKITDIETTYATNDKLNELNDKITNIETTYAKKTDIEGILSGQTIFKIPNINMRIRKIENEIKRLQRDLDIIKSEK